MAEVEYKSAGEREQGDGYGAWISAPVWMVRLIPAAILWVLEARHLGEDVIQLFTFMLYQVEFLEVLQVCSTIFKCYFSKSIAPVRNILF